MSIEVSEWTTPEHSYVVPVAFVPDYESGGYTVFAYTLPGAISEGETIAEATAMIREATAGMIESYLKHGETVPWKNDAQPPEGWCKVERIAVECKL